jgi:L-asparaginase II
METPVFVPAATVRRADLPESWHFAAAMVVTPEGRPVFRLGGDSHTFFRSCAKPFQALPLVRALLGTGNGDAPARGGFELSDADLGLICASHSGGPQHVERARSLLDKGGFTEGDLLCGAHVPLDERYADELRAQGIEPTPLHNNCSGKHAGMLLACRLLGLPVADYIARAHPLQQRIFSEMERFTGVPVAELQTGVDGCSVPTFHLALTAAARAWAGLAAPRLAGLPEGVAAAAERVLEAMARAPEMVAGPGRFTTRLAEVTGGRVVGKEGAEGLYCIAVRGPVALGVALKIADGSDRARDGVAMEVLRQIGSLSGEEFEVLEREGFYRPEVRNHRGLHVGQIVPELEMEAL